MTFTLFGAVKKPPGPSSQVIRNAVKNAARKLLLHDKHDPFDFQLDAATAIAQGKDTVLIAPTGSGKTLVLAMPLLYHKDKLSIVVSPLQALETDQVEKMNELGISSLLVDTVDLSNPTIKACVCFFGLCFSPHAKVRTSKQANIAFYSRLPRCSSRIKSLAIYSEWEMG